MKNNGFTIRCSCHTYITLEWNGEFVFCFDNSLMCAEEMIYQIEKRTQMNFQDIPITGFKDDFQGLCFLMAAGSVTFGVNFLIKKKLLLT